MNGSQSTPHEVVAVLQRHIGAVSALAVTEDGSMIVSASSAEDHRLIVCEGVDLLPTSVLNAASSTVHL
jgi:hypothetical protein